jgi:hypothetical protein
MWPTSARSSVLLPPPDGPTSATTVPALICRSTSCRSVRGRLAQAVAVAGVCHGDRDRRDREAGRGGRPRVQQHALCVLADHQRPVGFRGLRPDLQERGCRDEVDGFDEAQAEQGQQGGAHVRGDVAGDDPPRRFAGRDRVLDIAGADHGLGGGDDDARDPRSRQQGEHGGDDQR